MATFRQYTFDEVWRPPTEEGAALGQTGSPFLDALCAQIRPSGYGSAGVVAKRLGIRLADLEGALNTLTGMSYRAWHREWMMRDAQWLLTHTLLSVGEVGRRLGYPTTSNFGHAFRRWCGCSPGEYRNDNRIIRRHVSLEILSRKDRP